MNLNANEALPRISHQLTTDGELEEMIDVIDRAFSPDTSVSDIRSCLCAMGTAVCQCANQVISGEEVARITDACVPLVFSDCRNLANHELQDGMAQAVIRVMVWRMGLLFAMMAVNNCLLTATNLEQVSQHLNRLVRLDRTGAAVPDREVLKKLLACAANAPQGELETVMCRFLKETGMEAVSPVRRYGHPIDSALVNALDLELINRVFRSFVEFNSDFAMGSMIASSIPVTQENYPALDRIVDECVNRLGIRRPYVIVTNHMSGLNAMAFGSDSEPYVAVTSLLTRIMTEDQMRFVIGHECGHIAMGHMVYHTAATVLSAFSQFIPIVGKVVYSSLSLPLNAWSRRSEITADRAGLHCCGSLEVARKALLQLESAFNSTDGVNMDEYLENSKRYLKGSVLRRLGEYGANHPFTPKRIEALDLFAGSRLYYEMMGLPVPAGVLSDKELEKQIENVLRVI